MNNPETNTKRKWPRRLTGTLGVIGLAAGSALATNEILDHKQEKGGLIIEAPEQATTPEQFAEAYQTEALPFAKLALDKLPTPNPETGQGIAKNTTTEEQQTKHVESYEIQKLVPNGGITAILSITRTPEGGIAAGELYVDGRVDSARMAPENQFATVIALEKDNPVFTTETDAPLNSQDFAKAVEGANTQDIVAVSASGENVRVPFHADFTPGQAPKFTDEDKRPTMELPTKSAVAITTNTILRDIN